MTSDFFDGAAAITAAGQSRRFGSDKALALWRGQTLLNHVAASLDAAQQKLLIAEPGRYCLPGWQVLADRRPGQGPLAGLELALQQSEYEWVAFAGVDQPALERPYWQALAAARTNQPGCLSVQALGPQHQPQPLAALYHRSLVDRVTALLGSGERRLRLACPADQLVTVTGLPARFFHNINRPEDLAQLEQQEE